MHGHTHATDRIPDACTAVVADTELVLMADRLVWWPEGRLLLLADSHFGKAATFRKAGLPVPVGTTERMLEVLSKAVERLQPSRLVILGDFVHSVISSRVDFERELLEWRAAHAALPITLVLGNHDRKRRDLFQKLELVLCEEEVCGPFCFCHDPFAQRASLAPGFKVGGHIHPGIRLGNDFQPTPCFWQGDDFLVLPAFGAFTGLAKISPRPSDVLFPICDGQIARVPASDFASEARS
jgi:DNA ligase-associated metallophosphoesterase